MPYSDILYLEGNLESTSFVKSCSWIMGTFSDVKHGQRLLPCDSSLKIELASIAALTNEKVVKNERRNAIG
jgi:hypothetical protein